MMIYHPEQRIGEMDLVDLEHGLFDHNEFSEGVGGEV
jgi:hypothetical protein